MKLCFRSDELISLAILLLDAVSSTSTSTITSTITKSLNEQEFKGKTGRS